MGIKKNRKSKEDQVSEQKILLIPSLAVATNKGGVLKTTITVNLAGVLSQKGKVLAIDMDNQGNVATSFGLNPDTFQYSIYDCIMDGLTPEYAIQNVEKNIDILPANDEMAYFEINVLSKIEKYPNFTQLLKPVLQQVKDQYDYILIDCPPSMGLTLANVLTAVEQLIIPFQAEPYGFRGLAKIVKACEDFKSVNPNLEILGVIPTLVDRATNIHNQYGQEARKFCHKKGIHYFDTEITRSVQNTNSLSRKGRPLTIGDPKNEKAQVYFELAKEIESLWRKRQTHS